MRKRICVFVVAAAVFVNMFSNVCAQQNIQNESEINENAEQINLCAPSAILMEQSTGKVLFEKNAHEPLPLASVTKIMTMLIVMEAVEDKTISFDDMVTGSENAKSMGGSTIFLDAGEKMSVYDLLKGVAVASGNDAAVALAEYVAGTEEKFVEIMNRRAKELNMENTQFKNPNGLDEDGHFSTAADIAIMSRELLKHEKIFEFTTIWTDSLRNGKFQLANTNKLIRFYDGANGLKTGSTSKAKNCLSATAKRDNMQLIAVVMAAPSSAERFADAKKLLDYGFANFSLTQLTYAGEDMGELPVIKGDFEFLQTAVKDNFFVLAKKSDAENVRCEKIFDENVYAPVSKGQKIGCVKIYKGDKYVGEVAIVSASEVQKLTFYAMVNKLMKKWTDF